jgi:hypothetical protein
MAVTARDLSIASLTAVRAKDRQGWLSLFEDDAVVEDPVGKSVLDPAGNGHRGLEAIGRFYDNVIAGQKRFEFRIDQSFLCGSEVANVAVFDITLPDDRAITVNLVINYKMSPRGKIAALRAFWEIEKIPGFS